MNPAELHAMLRLCHEAGHLKRSKRTGWWVAGISDPESVAEHSWRTAIIGYFIALAEGADPERTATIGVFHDLAETRTGDIEYVGRHYVTTAPDDSITADQAAGLSSVMTDGLLSLVREGEARSSLESACARDADKLECLLQAREYERQGNGEVRQWAENMAEAVTTATGKALAVAALEGDPGEWWRELSASYVNATYGARHD
jgi:putative hydrolase of HD superfamily